MKATRDLLTGVLNSVWSALVGFAVVPLYLKYLGIEAYGLIGFFATTQALLQLLDMGIAPTINREVARHGALGKTHEAGPLLHTLTWIYCGVAAAIGLASFLLAPWVATHWLHSSALDPKALSDSVALLGLVVACRWPIGLYQGVLLGTHRLALSSGLNMAMVTLAAAGAVAILAFVSPTIQAFFLWQAAMGLLYALAMRQAAWRALGAGARAQFELDEVKRVWRFSAGMSGVAISAIVLMQLDKVLLSRILPLEGFGQYALAGVVASALYILLTPTFNVIYPRLSGWVAQGRDDEVQRLYRSGTRMLTCVLFPIAAGASVFSYELLLVWTRNATVAAHSAPVVSLFLIGTALNGAMHFPYALQLAHAQTRLPLTINAILLVVLVPLTTVLALHYGAIGGAASWAVLNTIYLLVGTALTHRVFLRGTGMSWLTHDVLLPLVASALVVGLVGNAIHALPVSPIAMLALAAVLVAGCAMSLLAFTPDTRRIVQQLLFSRADGPVVPVVGRSR